MSGILNVRVGFATNSSSSHSVIIIPPGESVTAGCDLWGSHEYGWETFTLTERADKDAYFLLQTVGGYPEDTPETRTAMLDVIRTFGLDVDVAELKDAYIDHQSRWELLGSLPSQDRDMFLRELLEFIRRDDVAILGGNDNGGSHPFFGWDDDKHQDVKRWENQLNSYGVKRVRRDNGYWTLFDADRGHRARIQFVDGPTSPIAPELVDVKITDYCPYGCSFCYQGSTQAGRHAPLADIRDVARMLADMQVFEVALGGGEPTLHPEFMGVLRAFRTEGVVPNFTTRNLAAVTIDMFHDRWKEDGGGPAGAFAYSCHNVRDVQRISEHPCKAFAVAHIVCGTTTLDELGDMLRTADDEHIPVTLLGWKNTGRGEGGPTHQYVDGLVDTIRSNRPRGWPAIAIDTALAQELEQVGGLVGVDDRTYHTEDGVTSAYVDAVAMTCGPSSWEPERGSWPAMSLQAAFDAQWSEVRP